MHSIRSCDALDGAITAERIETKYLVDADRLPLLSRAVASRLTPHRFTGEGANRLPDAEHFVTTIYFDTPSGAYLAAAERNVQSNLKLRAKAYYDVHPSLVEMATSAEQILRHQPWVWFELKRRVGPSTSKRRFRFPKTQAAKLFSGELDAKELELDRAREQADAVALVAHVKAQSEPIVPSAVVNYRRLSFQNDDATLRVTIDLGLSFFRVPPDLWSRTCSLTRAELGRPAGVEQRAVVEVKRRGLAPEWLEGALIAAGLRPVTFSKFVAASQALRGGSHPLALHSAGGGIAAARSATSPSVSTRL